MIHDHSAVHGVDVDVDPGVQSMITTVPLSQRHSTSLLICSSGTSM